MTGPAGLATRTRTLCPCGHVTTVYKGTGGLFAPGWTITPETTEPFGVACRGCGKPRTIDPMKLRHAVAEGRREFRIR